MSDPFVSGVTWVGSCFSGGFVWKRVVSLKTLLLLREVTGEPCWNHGGYLMLVLRCRSSSSPLLSLVTSTSEISHQPVHTYTTYIYDKGVDRTGRQGIEEKYSITFIFIFFFHFHLFL